MRIMFWSETFDPNDYVGKASEIDPEDVARVVAYLKGGQMGTGYRGMARCRIKGDVTYLGSHDMSRAGFEYPEKCWYYIEQHGLWTPELDAVLTKLKG